MALRKLLEKKEILHHKSSFSTTSSSEDECMQLEMATERKSNTHDTDVDLLTMLAVPPKKSTFSGLFNRGKSWVKSTNGDKNFRTSSKHLLKYLPGINQQTMQRSKSMESFRSQESVQSNQTSPSSLEVTGDINFDEILKADDTKKVTLTPNRLRSIEVLKKMKRLQSREPVIVSSLTTPEVDILKDEFEEEFMPTKVKKPETLYEFLKSSGPEDFSSPKSFSKKEPKLPKRINTPAIPKNLGHVPKQLSTIPELPTLPEAEESKPDLDVYEFLKCENSTSHKLRHTKSFNVEGASKTFKKIGKILLPNSILPSSATTSPSIPAQPLFQPTPMRRYRSISEPTNACDENLAQMNFATLRQIAVSRVTSRRRHSTDFSGITSLDQPGDTNIEVPKFMFSSSNNLVVPELMPVLPTPPLTPMLSSKEIIKEFDSHSSSSIETGWTSTSIDLTDVFEMSCMCNDCLST
ncbi:hypothetical protein K7432_006501 [Basidiobolus ranarum]|uniref:Uncharacterized protein n=1 Tax=Basidiobolus ranarum TaxID=34480 RepID=A0ABR2WUV2_9FUNG